MKEMIQAGNFYDSLSPEEQKDLTEAVAESLFFQETAQKRWETALQEGLR